VKEIAEQVTARGQGDRVGLRGGLPMVDLGEIMVVADPTKMMKVEENDVTNG
jgi:hypothetical protein